MPPSFAGNLLIAAFKHRLKHRYLAILDYESLVDVDPRMISHTL
jgi:hypothetical protein